MYPKYKIGGCIINPGSWRSGFKSTPSSGMFVKVLSKGLEVNSINVMENVTNVFITIVMYLFIILGSMFIYDIDAYEYKDKKSVHKRKDPSWAAQTALILYIMGSVEFELFITYFTEKSSLINEPINKKKLIVIDNNWYFGIVCTLKFSFFIK